MTPHGFNAIKQLGQGGVHRIGDKISSFTSNPNKLQSAINNIFAFSDSEIPEEAKFYYQQMQQK